MKAGISIVAWSLCNTDMVAVNRLILTSFKYDNLTQSTTRKVTTEALQGSSRHHLKKSASNFISYKRKKDSG